VPCPIATEADPHRLLTPVESLDRLAQAFLPVAGVQLGQGILDSSWPSLVLKTIEDASLGRCLVAKTLHQPVAQPQLKQ
jgi:hypothetical protein